MTEPSAKTENLLTEPPAETEAKHKLLPSRKVIKRNIIKKYIKIPNLPIDIADQLRYQES